MSQTSTLPIVWRKESQSQEYEDARCRVFNKRIPARFPHAIIRPNELQHILAALDLAKSLECRVAVRSGGHSFPAWSIRDNSVLIDLVNFKHLSYDAKEDIVQASPSSTGSMINQLLTPHGRMIPVGHCGGVGIGGFLLQGGMGINARGYGWGCEYVVGIDAVIASGEVIHCSATENADLFWAARGAGPGFPAVVTRFYLKTRPMSAVYKKNVYSWPIDRYEEVMSWLLDIIPLLSYDVEILVFVGRPPGSDQITITVSSTAFAKSNRDARDKFKILVEGHPAEQIHAVDYADTSIQHEYDLQDAISVPGKRNMSDDIYLRTDVDFVKVMQKAFTKLPPGCIAYWEPLNPVSQRPLPDMALSLQTDHYIGLYAVYDDASEDVFYAKWLQEQMKELEPYSEGAYLGDADFQVRPTKFWSTEAGARLKQIRNRWDPNGLICGYLDKDDQSGVNGLPNLLASQQDEVN